MPAENKMPEQDDVKKKAFLRLAVAGGVTLAALGGLWWLDHSGGTPPPPESAPAPIVAASPPQVAAPEIESTLPPEEATENILDETQMEVKQTSTAQDAVAEAPPPPKVSNNPHPGVRPNVQPNSAASTLPQAANQPPVAAAIGNSIANNGVNPAMEPAARTSLAATPAPQAAALPARQSAPQPAPQNGNNFVVQLGVFSNPENARELVEKLKKQGVRAHLEARVQLGPYLNRVEAEKAQMEMRKLGYNAVLTQPYSVVPATK